MRTRQLMIAVGLGLGVWGSFAPAARADEEEPARRILLLDFEGAQAFGMRQWVAQRIRPLPNAEVVPKSEALGEKSSPKSAEGVAAVAERSDLCAVVRGTTVGKGGKWTLTLEVLDGATGEPIDTVVFESTWIMGIKRELDASFAERFEPVVTRCQTPSQAASDAEQAAAPVEEPTEEEVEPDEMVPEATAEPASKPERPRPSALEVELGLPLFTRRLRYEEDVTQTLRGYRLAGLAPGLTLGATWYPGAHFTAGVPAHIGITGGYFRGFPSAAEREGRSLDTTTQSYRVGLRVRIPVRPVEVGVVGEYGGHDYEVERDPITGLAVVPNVGYRFVRPAAVLGLKVGAFVAEAGGGVRIVLDTGELESAEFFPDLTGSGFDAALAAGVAVGPVALLARGELVRYRFDLRPSPANPSPYGVANIAIDSGHSISIVARLTLPLSEPDR